MGTILSALCCGVPILVMPRRAELMETRNNHQVATTRRLAELGMVDGASDEIELEERLTKLQEMNHRKRIGKYASRELLEGLSSFINTA